MLRSLLFCLSLLVPASGFGITEIPSVDLLHGYQQQLAAHPLTTKMLTGGTLAMCGDAIAQRKEDSYDVRRGVSFGLFDMCYRALQHYSFPVLVNNLQGQYLGAIAASTLPFVNPSTTQQYAASMEQTLGSQLIIVPFLYYPVFYSLTGYIQGLDMSASVARAQETFIPLMKRNLLFWIPVQFVQFGFVPTDLQIPFLSCAGLAWTFILSVFAGAANKQAQPQLLVQETDVVEVVEVINVPTTGSRGKRPTSSAAAPSASYPQR